MIFHDLLYGLAIFSAALCEYANALTMKREKRNLVYGPGSYIEWIIGIGTPVQNLEMPAASLGFFMRAIYRMPFSSANYTNDPNFAGKEKRSLTRWNLYGALAKHSDLSSGARITVSTRHSSRKFTIRNMSGEPLLLYLLLVLSCAAKETLSDVDDVADVGKLLSRKRRYLTFPEGSSFQLVYDLAYPSLGMGGLFVFGNTAALAWELPSAPFFFDKKFGKGHQEEEKEETTPEPTKFNYTDLIRDNGYNWPASNDYYWPDRRNYVKISPQTNQWPYYQTYRPVYYNRYNNNNGQTYRYHRMERALAHHVHRRTRRELYEKIEQFLIAIKSDGKACLLKAICQFTRFPEEKGTLPVEILKAILRVKPYDRYPDEDVYDRAANPHLDCDEMYPGCEGSILTKLFGVI